MNAPFNIGSVYSFNTKAPAILGSSFTNVKAIGITTYDIAITMANIDQMQRAVAPLLPAGSPVDATAYQYIIFLTASNQKIVLALAWIEQGTITLQQAQTVTAVISNVSLADVAIIQKGLLAMGYNSISISTS